MSLRAWWFFAKVCFNVKFRKRFYIEITNEEGFENKNFRQIYKKLRANVEECHKWTKINKNKKICNHRKPWGDSALAGQRLHSGKYCYLCQYCLATFYDTEVPLDLRIDEWMVGGFTEVIE